MLDILLKEWVVEEEEEEEFSEARGKKLSRIKV